MTDRAAAPRRRRGPSPTTVVLGSVAAFMAILAFLAFQVRAGNDPALHPTAKVAQAPQQQPRRIVLRKVEDDYVITKVIPAPQQTVSGSPAVTTSSSGGGNVSAPAPVVTSSPAPAPVPAPAPAPAPVTRSS
jgi:hypothetical protein